MDHPDNPTTVAKHLRPPPVPGPEAGRSALRALLKDRSMLSALDAIHSELGDIFQIPLPGFKPVFLVGPEANRYVAVTGRDRLLWRPPDDPVTRLLGHGLLVTDGEQHDDLRKAMQPSLHRSLLPEQTRIMHARSQQVTRDWQDGQTVDMLVEMRKVALLILMDALFDVDMTPDLERMWKPILKLLAYISPGAWLVLPKLPRLGYRGAIREMDAYLYGLIAKRRSTGGQGSDLLTRLVSDPKMTDVLIRDQLLTMLIAGHDTSTALLAWTLYLLGMHPQALETARQEVDGVVGKSSPDYENTGRLEYMEKVIHEALRLYPPIHIGNRMAATDLEFNGYRIPAGTRVVYSIYLTHRHAGHWEDPSRFEPERFQPEASRQRNHYTYVPFGGGPRNCIGMAFALVEVKVVLAHLLQNFEVELLNGEQVHAHMGATLEPRPGVQMRVLCRT